MSRLRHSVSLALGSCGSDAATGYSCVLAPSLNLRYDQGSAGKLMLIK